MRGSTPYILTGVGILVLSILLFVEFGGLSVVFSMGFGNNFHTTTIQGTAATPLAPAAQAPAPKATPVARPASAATPAPAPTSTQDQALLALLGKMAEMSQLQSEAVASQTKILQQQTEAFNKLREQLASRPQPEEHHHSHECSHSEWSKPIQRYRQ